MTAAASWFPGTIPPAPIRAQLDDIAADVCASHRVTLAELFGRDRHADIVAARREFAVRGRATGASYPVLGRYMGRDHSTVQALVKGLGWHRA